MKEKKFDVGWEKERQIVLSEASEAEEGSRMLDNEGKEGKGEKEQSLDVRGQIDWWDTKAEEEPDPNSEQVMEHDNDDYVDDGDDDESKKA